LWIAMPGQGWAEVANARIEGQTMVGRVPMLTHAVVVAQAQRDVAASRAQAASARKTDRAVTAAAPEPSAEQPITVGVNAQTTTALPAPGANGIITVTQPTDFYFDVEYLLPACAAPPRMRSYVVFVPQAVGGEQPPTRTFEFGSFDVQFLRDGFVQLKNITSDVNGQLTFNTSATCTEIVDGQAVERYALLHTGFVIDVNIQNTPTDAPVITQAPADQAAVVGQNVTFSVTASGPALSYQWQRSDSSGANYADVPGASAASVSLTAALADDASLWRVVVSNAVGSATSIPARLTVVQGAIAPAISADPRDQSVTAGQTASFTVAASGSPTPGVQWQQRADANAQWSDIAGANALTYTTEPTTLAQSGSQYRAVVSNSAGNATSLAATLTVSDGVSAPSITSQPQSQSVQAGNAALFAVTASGSSPLGYQWFKDGVAITGANASELLLPTVTADAGSTFQITVSVSNAAGSVTSVAAVLTVTAGPTGGGTLINAAQGGFVSANTGAEVEPTLVIPAGALAADATLSVTAQSSTVANLPPEITPLGDVINVGGPSGATFSTPATLYLAEPSAVAEGEVLAVVELEGPVTAQRSSARSAAESAAVPARAGAVGNLRRIAAGQGTTKAQGAARRHAPGGATILGAGDPLRVLCPDAQAVRGGAVLTDLTRPAVRFVLAEVPESACTGKTTTKPRAVIPGTTTAPCTSSEFPAIAAGNSSPVNLVSRHVHCQRGSFTTSLGGNNLVEVRWRIGSDGVADKLNKTYRVRLQLLALDLEPGSTLRSVSVLPLFDCAPQGGSGSCKADARTPVTLQLNGEVEIKTTVSFAWDQGDDSYRAFIPFDVQVAAALPGEDINQRNTVWNLGQPPTIRCDKKMAVNRGDGCVYPDAPAVLVLNAIGDVKEAAEHIRDAQAAGSRGGLTPLDGAFVASVSNGLQRTRVTGLGATSGANNNYACRYADSVIEQRPQASSSCPNGRQGGCDCDEYPFKSTWNGAFLDRSGTSARFILGNQNQLAGNRLVRFYQAERVLDFTPDPGIVFNLGNESVSIPARVGGDDFWVHIE
jgi:Immunoglobulin I-set domain